VCLSDARIAVRSLTNTYFELGKPHFYVRFVELSFNACIKELSKYNLDNNDHTSIKKRKRKLHVSAVRPASGVSQIHMQAIKAFVPCGGGLQ
jgi:hypothetical protein